MRQEPNFGKKDSFNYQNQDDPWGCVRIPIIIVVSYFVFMAITRVTSGGGSKLDHYICYGTLIIFVVILLLGLRDQNREQKILSEKKQAWKNSSKVVNVPIESRHGYPGGSYEDEYGIPHRSRPSYRLVLRLPNQVSATVHVSESVYKALENKNTVRIYYEPESPTTFMIDEEL